MILSDKAKAASKTTKREEGEKQTKVFVVLKDGIDADGLVVAVADLPETILIGTKIEEAGDGGTSLTVGLIALELDVQDLSGGIKEIKLEGIVSLEVTELEELEGDGMKGFLLLLTLVGLFFLLTLDLHAQLLRNVLGIDLLEDLARLRLLHVHEHVGVGGLLTGDGLWLALELVVVDLNASKVVFDGLLGVDLGDATVVKLVPLVTVMSWLDKGIVMASMHVSVVDKHT